MLRSIFKTPSCSSLVGAMRFDDSKKINTVFIVYDWRAIKTLQTENV